MSSIRYLGLILFIFLAGQLSFGADVCQFKKLNDITLQGCTDFQFSDALASGNLAKISSMITENPDYVFACNQTETEFADQYSSLTFAICHAGTKATLPAIVDLLLKNGADPSCRSQVSRLTALQCANQIADPSIRSQVVDMLHAAGAGE